MKTALNHMFRVALTALVIAWCWAALAQTQPVTYANLPPLNNTVAFVGDSVQSAATDQNVAGLSYYFMNRGPQTWARILTNQRIYSPPSMNFGVRGNTTQDVINRIGPIVAANAGTYYVAIGTNNPGVISLQNSKDQLNLIWDTLQANGATVIASTILPRNLASTSTIGFLNELNTYIKAQVSVRKRFYVTDPALNYVDPTSTTWSPRTNYSYDGLHPKGLGAYYATLPLVATLNQIYPATGGVPNASIADAYDAVNAPHGNLLTNGTLAGTGGTLTAGGGTVSGTASDSWTLGISSNGGTVTSLVATGSQVALTNGLTSQRVVVSGTYSGAGSTPPNSGTSVYFLQDLGSPATVVSAGDTLQATANLSVATGNSNISGVNLQILAVVNGVTYVAGDGDCITGDLLPSDPFSGTLKTAPLTIPPGTITQIRVWAKIWLFTGSTLTAAADVNLSSVALRKL